MIPITADAAQALVDALNPQEQVSYIVIGTIDNSVVTAFNTGGDIMYIVKGAAVLVSTGAAKAK